MIIIALIVVIIKFSGAPENQFWEDPAEKSGNSNEGLTYGQIFILNVLNQIRLEKTRFDFLLAGMVFLVWLRLIFYFRGFRQFGPMFRMIQAMIVDLV